MANLFNYRHSYKDLNPEKRPFFVRHLKCNSDIRTARQIVPKRDNNAITVQCVPKWDNALEYGRVRMAYFFMILARHIALYQHTYTYYML